jgi:hypothetical protein
MNQRQERKGQPPKHPSTMIMVQCNAMSMPVDNDASSGAASVSSNYHMPMVHCNEMAWTDETEEGLLKVLVTRRNPDTGAAVTTAEQTMPRMALTGKPAERRYKERKWWKRLWQAMPRVQKRKSCSTVLAVEHAAKCQCKKDECQTDALLANWQGQGLARARVRPEESRIGDPQSDACERVPELGSRAHSPSARARLCHGWGACRAGFARASGWRCSLSGGRSAQGTRRGSSCWSARTRTAS